MLVGSLSGSATAFVRDHGLYAVFALMLVDAVLPAASELVMVYGGAVAAGAFGARVSLFGAHLGRGLPAYLAIAVAGTLGYLLGSIGGWGIGFYGGRPLLERHGGWLHVTTARLARAERWFDRFEDWAVFLGRITPVVRSFVSIPAGVFRVGLGRYTVLTVAGSALWCFALAAVGWALGSNYERFHHAFDYVEVAVVAGVLLLAAYLILRIRRSSRLS